MAENFKNRFLNFIKNLANNTNEAAYNSPDKLIKAQKEKDALKLEVYNEINNYSFLNSSALIFYQNFFSFLRVNLILTLSFLIFTFLLLFFWGSKINSYSDSILHYLPFLRTIGVTNFVYLILAIIFFIFFTWLRSSYLAIVGNYFCFKKDFKSLSCGFGKILSFILIELMQIVMIIIGIFLLVLSPIFGAKYFIALSIMFDQDDDAIDSIFESIEYTRGQILLILHYMLFITLLSISLIIILFLVTSLIIENQLILISLNFFLFSFLILPLHSCYRFALYRNIQNTTGDLKCKTTNHEKAWFIFSRLAFLALLVINIFLIATGSFGEAVDKVVTLIL